jgi:hypothetical protein
MACDQIQKLPRTPTQSPGDAEKPTLAALLRDSRGATTLEWVRLLLVIGLPSYWLLQSALRLLVEHYHMMTTLNGLPLP